MTQARHKHSAHDSASTRDRIRHSNIELRCYQKGWQVIAAPEANCISPSHRRLKSGVPKGRKFEPTIRNP
jgi:hypothetical protein